MSRALLLLLVALSASVHAATYTIQVGGAFAGEWTFPRFFPNAVTINPGDTVLFNVSGNTPYTVVFTPVNYLPYFDFTTLAKSPYQSPTSASPITVDTPNNTFSSGVLQGFGTQFSFVFPNAGVYPFIDILHPGQVGTITVGVAPLPPSSVDIIANGQQLQAYSVTTGLKGANNLNLATGITVLAVNVVGKRAIRFVAGYGDGISRASFARFVPSDFTIFRDESIVFFNTDIQDHALGIIDAESNFDYSANDGFYPSKWFIAEGNAGAYEAGFISSGRLPTNGTWRVTFIKTGQFKVSDFFENSIGMTTTITVKNPVLYRASDTRYGLTVLAIVILILVISVAGIVLSILIDYCFMLTDKLSH